MGVCSGSGFGCAPPLLAGVLGCVCVCVPAPLVPRHSWLGCAAWVFVRARASAAPRHSWLGCWGVCVFVCLLHLYPATPGWGVRRGCVCLGLGFGCAPPLLAGVLGCVCAPVPAPRVPRHSWLSRVVCVCVCLGSGFGCAPPLLAGVLGCVCVRVRAPLVPRHSWLGCAARVRFLWLGFRLRSATPGSGVGVCVCSCARSACTLPLLAGVCGVGVCVCARVSAAPRHSWLGCWACVLVCVLPLYPATPGWGLRCGCVCLGSGCRLRPATLLWGVGVCVCWCACSSCTPPLLAGVCGVGVCAWARVSAAPVHCWLGCWGVSVLYARSACTPPLLAGVCGVGVSGWARVSAAPRHSWLGCWAVCVLVCVLPLYPATPGCGVRCGCVCLGSGCQLRPATPGWGVGVCVCWCVCSSCTPPLLAGVCGVGVCAWARVSAAPRLSWLGCWGVCVLVCPLHLHPATPRWGARCGCVCLGSCFCCAPPLLAGVLGCLCARVRASLVPRHSWLGCAVWVCVFGLGFRLRPATPGWAVGVCVCWCARSACTPPLLAGVCVVDVCAWAQVLAALRLSWLGFVVCGLAVAWHLFLCRGPLRVVCALRVCGPRRQSLLGTCPCALVVAGGVPLRRASWPRVVRRASCGPVPLGAPVGFPDDVVPFPTLGACAPGFTGWLHGARGGRPRTGLIVPAAGPRRGSVAGLAPRGTRSGPRDGVVRGGCIRHRSWAACAAVVCVCGPSQ